MSSRALMGGFQQDVRSSSSNLSVKQDYTQVYAMWSWGPLEEGLSGSNLPISLPKLIVIVLIVSILEGVK